MQTIQTKEAAKGCKDLVAQTNKKRIIFLLHKKSANIKSRGGRLLCTCDGDFG
jgi:hypothetical protein